MRDFQNISDGAILSVADMILENQKDTFSHNSRVEASQGETGSENGAAVTLEMLRRAQEIERKSAAPKDVVIPKVYTAGMGGANILKVTMKRQLEEIRQKMTLQSAVAMERKGIHIEYY